MVGLALEPITSETHVKLGKHEGVGGHMPAEISRFWMRIVTNLSPITWRNTHLIWWDPLIIQGMRSKKAMVGSTPLARIEMQKEEATKWSLLARFYKESFPFSRRHVQMGQNLSPLPHQKQHRDINIGMDIPTEALGPLKPKATEDNLTVPRKADFMEMASCNTVRFFTCGFL